MDSHTPIPKVSRLEVITTGSRRRWTLEEKLRIVAESFSGHRAASSTARRYGLSSSQLFAWRKLAREGRLSEVDEPSFAAAIVVPDVAATPERPAGLVGAGRMEIVVGEPMMLFALLARCRSNFPERSKGSRDSIQHSIDDVPMERSERLKDRRSRRTQGG